MRIVTAIAIQGHEITSKSKSATAHARNVVEENNIRCKGEEIERRKEANDDTADADCEAGAINGTGQIVGVVGACLMPICPLAGAIVAAIGVAIMIAQAINNSNNRDEINAENKSADDAKLCAESGELVAKKLDDQVKNDGEDLHNYMRRVFEHGGAIAKSSNPDA